MVILHIDGAKAIFLLFYDELDTESKECEIQMRIYQLIFTHKHISKAQWDNDILTVLKRRKILW